MATIAEQLVQLNDAKLNIKAAIEAKGVSDVGLDITVYGNKIEEIPQVVSESKIVVSLEGNSNYMNQKIGTSVDASNLVLGSNVTSLQGYFGWDYSKNFEYRPLQSVDLTAWNLGEREDYMNFNSLFQDQTNLSEIKGFAFPKGRCSLEVAFRGSGIIDTEFLKDLDSSRISSGWGMFSTCKSLESIDLNWTTCDFGIHGFADQCPNLTTVNLPNWNFNRNAGWWEDPSLAPVYALRPFKECPKLANVTLNWGFFNRVMGSVFSGKGTCRNTDFSGIAWKPGTDLESWLHDLYNTVDGGHLPAGNSRLYLDASQIENLQNTTSAVDSSKNCYETITSFGWDIIDVANTPD